MIRNRQDAPSPLPPPHRIRPQRWHTGQLPFVSVLVPVRNEGRFITSTLRQLLEQDYPSGRFEIIVADGESTDDTREQVRLLQRAHAHLQLVPNPRRWSSAGRNAALEVARGEIVVIVDGHCDLNNRHYLANLVDAFERSGADSVGRPQPQDVAEATPLQQAIAACRASRLGHHPASFIYSGSEQFVRASSVAVAYRRRVFDTIGTFDDSFDACEDVEFNHRLDQAGLSCYFTPTAAVHYHPRGTLRGLFRQMMRYGRGRVRLLRKHPGTFTLPGFIPALFTAGLLLGPLSGLLIPGLFPVYLGCVFLYLLLVMLTAVSITRRSRNVRVIAWVLPVFLAIHLGAGSGILLEVIRPGRSPHRTSGASTPASSTRRAA